ncbi:MAG TPA: PAS domain S-box protein, partial [Alphaproteobacteria bacterium]|nr:PAS domain S-box protein [Alphaproteobacteria bacterium]
MTNSKHLLSKQIRQGVVSHIIRYDLLRRQEFRDKFLSRIGPGHLDEFAGKRRRILWEVIVAGAEAYLTDRAMATSDFHLAAATSRTTAGRCLRTLKQLGIVHLQVDQSDRRRSLVSISAPFQDILDLYVDECFEEFEDLITTHHDRERHKAEMALEDSEVRWRSLAEESPDHVILIDTNFEIQFINHTMPGLTPEQVSGTQISSYLRDEDRQHVMNALEGVTSSRHPASFETSCVTADGEILFFESRVVARVVDDAVIGLTIHARNISDRKLTEQALKNREARFR